jgi:hypothetical protein
LTNQCGRFDCLSEPNLVGEDISLDGVGGYPTYDSELVAV